MHGGSTRSGSRAANGIAPSVMNDRPSTYAGLPASCSSGSHRFGNSVVARASPSGGVMPAAITAAIGPFTPLVEQPDGEGVGDLVERPAHVRRHHRPEDQPEHGGVGALQPLQPLGQLGPAPTRAARR